MDLGTRLVLMTGGAALLAVVICCASAWYILRDIARCHLRKQAWYYYDIAGNVISGATFMTLAITLITTNYLPSQKWQLQRDIESERKFVAMMASSQPVSRSTVFSQIRQDVKTVPTKDQLNKLVGLLEQEKAQDQAAAETTLMAIDSLKRMISMQEEMNQIKNIPEALRWEYMQWWVAAVLFILTPIGLGLQFAKVIAARRGLTEDAK